MPAALQKIRQATIKTSSKPVSQYYLDGTFKKSYTSMSAAERATGIHYQTIGTRVGGKGKTAGGFIWKWIMD